MNTVIKCCHNCKEREVGCHDTCPRYLKEKEKHREIMQYIHKDYETDQYVKDSKSKNYNRYVRRKRKK